ncbi:nucleotidyltransferase [Erwinia sp. S59]|uniref:nucleotidyltransferase domain-containing protein n=1 Tax=Erwinia sp. S59 TaxID=2769340 RepID=UPI00190CBEBB|nr:nucleotidyltransferase [Erwinia sp. S59]MBK0089391.1 nucleotidyltransferase [Erwinia sp. S59]
MRNPNQLRLLSTTQKQHIANILEALTETLDLTDTQYRQIQQAYRGVGTWLAESDDPLLRETMIYSQGSVRLNTTVKPGPDEPFDIDLICYLPHVGSESGTDVLDAVERRLNEHERYKTMFERLPRGFRINYAALYHLDITPGTDYYGTVELKGHPLWVTDRKTFWKESNPDGYARWFDGISEKEPLRLEAIFEAAAADSALNKSLAPLPDHTRKKLLNRIVQILKRHRDEWCNDQNEDTYTLKPISAIITTLAAQAYQRIIDERRAYDNDLDIIIDVIELIPNFIKTGAEGYQVLNPSMPAENFAEKWNIIDADKGQKLIATFKEWHKAVWQSFSVISASVGQDNLLENISNNFGDAPVRMVREQMVDNLGTLRRTGRLGLASGTGSLITGTASAVQQNPVPSNTFYGSASTTAVPVPSNTFFGE